MMKVTFLVVCIIFSTIISHVFCDMSVESQPNGQFDVVVNTEKWLRSAPTKLHVNGAMHSTSDGTLSMVGDAHISSGHDRLGAFDSMTYIFGIHDAPQQMHANIRKYRNIPGVVFSQKYPRDLDDTSVGDQNKILSSFPNFKIESVDEDKLLGFLIYGDLMIGWEKIRMERWNSNITKLPDGLLSGPLLLYDGKGNVIIISPFSKFTAQSHFHDTDNKEIGWGIMGSVDHVPAGYEMETLIFYSSGGINKAMEEWGELLRYQYKRDQYARENDISVKYIGYYTDNGGYYYHATEPGLNYEETILKEYDYSKQLALPYRYIQYDDWFYPIKGTGYGATVTWDALPNVFPHGLQYLYNNTGLPVVAHNRYWSANTTYAKQNGGKFNFYIDGENSIPDDQDFWDYLFSTAKLWGLVVYEQDWLNFQMERIDVLHTDLMLAERWLKQMGESASRYGIQLQYCMCLPRELMAGLEIPAVSHARASGDYVDDVQWKIGVTSMFADAMGIAPFKDNLWSRPNQPGNRYKRIEKNVMREVVVALLSTGPVGPSDRIGYTDNTLLMRTCTDDGLLLKPSKPATVIDQQVYDQAFNGPLKGGELWSTYSDISGWRFGLIFASELQQPYKVDIWNLHSFKDNKYELFTYPLDMNKSDKPEPFSDSNPLHLDQCGKDAMCLHYITPKIYYGDTSVILLGELGKLVPMSPQRITEMKVTSYNIEIALSGSPKEVVNFYVWTNGMPWHFTCTIGGTGSATINMREQTCYRV